ncbi:MAG: hypothetical protein OEY19_08390 [Gammaproteobacteria bacterium]|nr:hypothetical protein [Gammaproteobacteria bacterium]MDH5629183.1 hypothetical protein [Gammaproteobacteria bacterium]
MIRMLIMLFLILSIFMSFIDMHAKTEITPLGTISFEFIGSIENLELAMIAWGDIGRTSIALNLGIDFLYLIIYSAILALAFYRLSNAPNVNNIRRYYLSGVWLAVVVGIIDILENLCLIQLLYQTKNEIWAIAAYNLAILKFTGIAVCLIMLVVGYLYVKCSKTHITKESN